MFNKYSLSWFVLLPTFPPALWLSSSSLSFHSIIALSIVYWDPLFIYLFSPLDYKLFEGSVGVSSLLCIIGTITVLHIAVDK